MLGLDRRRRLATWRVVLVGIVLLLIDVPAAWAHKGPPFALFLDKPAADYKVSVWADPDIGQATFYIIIESPEGGQPDKAPQVAMWAEPISGRLHRARYAATRQALRNQMEFEAKPLFDQRDMWTVGFEITGSDALPEELTAEVESTPPGTGPWDLVIYVFPFLMIGGLWAMAVARRRRIMMALAQQEGETSRSTAGRDRDWVETESTDEVSLQPGEQKPMRR